MINKMHEILEFDKVLDLLKEHALSDKAKVKLSGLRPYLSLSEVARHLKETTEAKLIMDLMGTPPLSSMSDIEKTLSLLGKGSFLLPEQLSGIAQFLTSCRRLKAYLKKAESTHTGVAFYGSSIYDLSSIEDEISHAVRGSQIDDNATSQLSGIRRKITNSGDQIKSKLDSLLRNNKEWFSEDFVSFRNGHYTLPVKREFKLKCCGTVIDISQSGGTCFIEPSAVSKLQEEVSILHIEEENEVRRILYKLTALVEEHLPTINTNIEAMESLDFIFSKAKLSIAMKASPLPVLAEREIVIKAGRHPLLNSENIIPLDFHIGGENRGVVVTGPNTGGKTVALKTIGLLSMMAQCGLHVPAEGGSFSMNNYILCDIGDRQSISENLSTFSAHMTNIIQILKSSDERSLVLLDELGSGTDPAEGMGLAVAILEELLSKHCLFVVTTHYPEIKTFAESTPGLVNARMAFDRQSLLPLYRLEIGEAGESCALYISKRLGLPQKLIERAAKAAYNGKGFDCPDTNIPETTGDNNDNIPVPKKVVIEEPGKVADAPRIAGFNIGDSVMVYPQKIIGIVYRQANEKGDVGVQIKNSKLLVNHKRLKLHVPASELYPENYDFSIVFDSVENRKARHTMSRKHEAGLVIEVDKD